MMEWYDALPAEAREECDALIFLVLREGLKVLDDEKREGKECERDGEREEGVSRFCLQCKCN